MNSHPFVGAAIVLAIVGYVLQLDGGAILLSIAPTLAVIVSYYLGQRTRRQGIRDAQEAVQRAELAASESKSALGEVHTLVNSQKDDLERKLAERDRRIDELEQKLGKGHVIPEPT